MKKHFLLNLGLICLLCLTSILKAQNTDFWTKSSDNQVPLRPNNQRVTIPLKYEVWKLNFQQLKTQLDLAPMENTISEKKVIVSLPMPNGKLVDFEIHESPVAHPDLMHKYSFKTFIAVGTRDKAYSGRIGYTINGLHASLDTPDGEVYIDPYATELLNYYVIYYTAEALRPEDYKKFVCGTSHGNYKEEEHTIAPYTMDRATQRNAVAENVKVYKYRLAVGSTGEFTQNYGGTKPKVMAKIVALVNKTNKVTMNENAIKLELIANNDTLIWSDPKTDPFPNGDLGKDLKDANEVVLKKGIISFSNAAISQLVGNSNFDVGHIVTMGCSDVGGVVGGLICTQNGKGTGCSCDQTGNTDLLAINIMSHEMAGHQFNASHTMSACSALPDGVEAGQVGSSSKIEPGSGSTIMSYDGTCGADNITGTYWKTKGIYSVGSLGQIRSYSRSVTNGGCGTIETTINHQPTVEILHPKKGLYIPRYTPFELISTAKDEDNDNLTYSWEQSDIGNFKALGKQDQDSNSFRVFDPATEPNRVFPKLSDIVAGKANKAELLPDTSRLYTFVISVRDNNPLGGGLALDTIKFRSTHKAGPFAVTFPNTVSDTASAENFMLVKWNVANTDNELVNCKKVNILLSIDGGLTYPYTLLKNTENDGSEGVILPKGITSTKARIRINAVDNIFFDISNKDFKIMPVSKTGFTVALNTESAQACLPDKTILNIQSSGFGGFDKIISLSVSDLPQGAIVSFDKSEINPGENAKIFIDMTNVAFQGNNNIKLRAIAGNDTIYRTTIIKTINSDFSAAKQISPANGATAVNILPNFTWSASPYAQSYDIQIATNPSFAPTTVIFSKENLTALNLSGQAALAENNLYYWRMRAKNECKAGDWSVASPFHTLVQSCKEYSNTTASSIPASQPVTINSEINMTEAGAISDVNVTAIKGKHANFGHLEIRLLNENGKSALLSDKKCSFTGGIFFMRYDDEATQVNNCDKLLSAGIPYRPETPLAVFDGEDTKGKWTLQVKDVASGDGGNLDEWTIRFCAAKAVTAPTIVKNDTLKVRPNKGVFITDGLLLAADDKATPQQLTYTLITLPQFGNLERWGGGNLAIGSTFTQAELNQKHSIRYVHGNNNEKNDYYLFIITDGEGGFLGTLRYNILIDQNAQLSNTQDPTLANSIKVYPNPSNSVLNVSILENYDFDTKLQLFNVNGQLVAENAIQKGGYSSQFDTTALSEGVYLLKLSNLNGFATKRVVIQH